MDSGQNRQDVSSTKLTISESEGILPIRIFYQRYPYDLSKKGKISQCNKQVICVHAFICYHIYLKLVGLFRSDIIQGATKKMLLMIL